jgi:lysophospholipase L1-like esterase
MLQAPAVAVARVQQHVQAAPPVSPDRLANPSAVLAPDWRSSGDRAVSVAGDATGLHVLVADEASGYAWRTAATLTVRGTDTTEWIGQACVTGSGDEVVVVYAPRQISNLADAQGFTALAALVNLATGKVTSLGGGFSISYFDPGCGTGEQVVLTQGGWGGAQQPGQPESTRLVMLDARTGRTVFTVAEPGQVTSAVPYQGQIAAVYGPGVVTIGTGGQVRTLARATGAAFRLVPDSAGGLGFQTMAGTQVRFHRYTAGRDQVIGTARAGSVELQEGGGRVWLTGPQAAQLGHLPAQWRAIDAPALSQVSTTGALAITSVLAGRLSSSRAVVAPDLPQPVRIGALVMATGKRVAFTVPQAPPTTNGALAPMAGSAGGNSASATHAARAGVAAANPATVTYDPDRTCSVPRNDPTVQTYQPSAEQVEWAADQAVQGDLTDTRGANLYGAGLPAYTPQGMFPAPGLTGGGSVPAQILLGIMTQESNLEQASNHAIIGQTGNVLPSYNWYGNWVNDANGVPQNTGQVNWSNVDCGYGIAQVTTGMCMSGNTNCPSADGTALPANDQRAVSVDYQANIAAGLQNLEGKWNELYKLGITANGANPMYIENWWFALWDYNSGLEPNAKNGNTTGCSPSPTCHDSGGDWGLGWANNPANSSYPPDRPQFLDSSAAATPDGQTYSPSWDQAHPNYWSYEEKVIGFAFNAFTAYSFVDGKWEQAYAYGAWPSTAVDPAEPAHTALCVNSGTTNDHCNPSVISSGSPTQATDPCSLTGSLADHCWWHSPLSWVSCTNLCGTQVLTYGAGAADPGNPGVPAGYAPDCSTSGVLPSNAVIVDDVTTPAALGCPGENWTSKGTMSWMFGSSGGTYPSKIDFHQIGAGFGGHFWFTHTIPTDQSGLIGPSVGFNSTTAADPSLEITGTWVPPSTVTGWTRIMVHVPNVGAWDPDASYQINLGGGTGTRHRIVNQAKQANTWVDLGFFDLSAGATVSLDNAGYVDSASGTSSGYDVAWDAAAFIPVGGSFNSYVAMGDSYASGEGLLPFNADSDYNYSGMTHSCHRSSQAYPELVTLPGQSTPIAQQAAQPGSNTSFAFTACSGVETNAMSWDSAVVDSTPTSWDSAGYVDWGNYGLNYGSPSDPSAVSTPTLGSTVGELPQADEGWLNPETSLVTVTIGGNDARFSDVLSACAETDNLLTTDGNGCSSTGYYMKRASNGVTDPQPLYETEQTVIKDLQAHLVGVYNAIAAAAPNAMIVVVGYPRLFPGDQAPTAPCAPDAAVDFPIPDVAWLNQMGDLLDQTISQAVTAVNAQTGRVFYIDPNSAFEGHRVCDSAPWINGIVNEETSTSGTSTPGIDSFHPNAFGQAALGQLVTDFLATHIPLAQQGAPRQ